MDGEGVVVRGTYSWVVRVWYSEGYSRWVVRVW